MKGRLRRAFRIAGIVGAVLFVATLGLLYALGGVAQDDDVTAANLSGRWETRLIRYDNRTAVRLYAVFDADIDEVWQFVLDYEKYPDRIPYLKSGKTLESWKDGARIELEIRALPTNIRERVKMKYDVTPDLRVASWTQEEGTLVHNDGEWRVERAGSRTFLRYTMCESYGGVVPDWLTYGLLRLNAGMIVKAVQGRIDNRRAGRFPRHP